MSVSTPLDASYDRLLKMLASRGLEWLRQHVEALPDPLPSQHPAIPHLSTAAWVGEILSGLRGCKSPLQVIVARRLSPEILSRIARRIAESETDPSSDLVQSVFAAQAVLADDPRYQLARQILTDETPDALSDRLAIEHPPAEELLRLAEEFVVAPMPSEALSQAYLERFTMVLMRLYGFGARRPQFSHPRVYGQVFANCLRYAEWARKEQSLIATVQLAFCLRLIDPDHDIAPMLAEVIPYQRPDGSFPARSAYSTECQELDDGVWATLMTVAALHMATYRRWNGAEAAPTSQPLHGCRDMAAAIVVSRGDNLRELPKPDRLRMAATLSCATGEDWFSLAGLAGQKIQARDILAIAPLMFGSFTAARHARSCLDLGAAWPALNHAEQPPHMQAALNWLRGSAVTLGAAADAAMIQTWDAAARSGDQAGFLACCAQAIACQSIQTTPAIRIAACRMMLRDLAAIEDATESLQDQSARLARMSLIAWVFEGDSTRARPI